MVKLVQAHLSKLSADFSLYFQDIEVESQRLDWVRNQFIVSESSNNRPGRLQEYLTEFWCEVEKEYPELGKHALIELVTAVSTLPPELSKLMKDKQAQVSH